MATGKSAKDARSSKSADRLTGDVAALGDALDAVGEGVVLFDADDRITYANSRLRELLPGLADMLVPGIGIEDLLAAKLDRGLLSATIEPGPAWLERQLERHRNPPSEIELDLADGRIFRLTHRKSASGGSVSVWTDVTERRAVRNALDDSERRYREFANMNPAAVIVQVDGKVAFANEAACRMFRADSPADLLGRESLDLVAPESRKRVLERRRHVEMTGQAIPFAEGRHRRLDGAIFPSEMAARPVFWEGKPGTNSIIFDVTERKETEKTLRESEQRYRSLVEGSIQGITVTTETERLFANQAFADMLGYDNPDDVLANLGPSDHFLPEERDKFIARRVERINSGGVEKPFEIRIVRKDGTVVTALTTGKQIVWFGKRAALATWVDITDKKRAEEALQEREQYLRELIDGSIQAVSVSDGEKRLFVNRTYAQLLGYSSPEEVLENVGIYDVFLPHKVERIKARRDRRLRKGGQSGPIELDYVRKDGTTITALVVSSRISWFGKPALLGTGIDITERKRAAEALRTSERRFRALIENALDVIAILDRDGVIKFASPSVEVVTGFDPDELIGQNGLLFVHPDDRDEALERLIRLHSVPNATEAMSFRFQHKAGGWRYLETVGRNLLDDPSVDGLVINSRDATDRIEAEASLRQAHKMEAIGQLTGGVAHDFNNLLAVIAGNADLLRETLDAPPAERLPLVDAITRTAERGAGLTRSLLAFSRKQALQPKIIDVNEQLSDLFAILRRTLGEDIEIRTRTATSLWHCLADRGQLENALLNLTLNARDAMPGGGKLTIETANVTIDENQSDRSNELKAGEYVMLAISDTGIGIPAELLPRAFDPFFTTKPAGKGTGLGLSMVFGFVKQSGGHVTIYSEPNEGTTVKIYLPRARGGGEADRIGPASDEPATHGELILLVEDDPDLLALAATQLDSLGYRVLKAGDGPTALGILEREPHIDLLLTDVVLPGQLRGPAIAAAARESHPKMAVLYMSGYTEDAIVHHGRLDEGIILLQKPFRKIDLARKVREALGRIGGTQAGNPGAQR
ncbi:Blue-light-activated protein [Oceanibacterium hippocampi]|uniref:histidine kinase n=2 Tax=Oceanibacterium hippocampi TaxID=745714 RepID=A0A1Y5R9G1_9PROT|nr:Blue-light-activated protein [Oceanibacterium hippocampi]